MGNVSWFHPLDYHLDGWWIVHMIVLPFLDKFLMHSTTDTAMKESRPDVGSSQNRIYNHLLQIILTKSCIYKLFLNFWNYPDLLNLKILPAGL